jgi:hypothetical protein
MMVYSQIWLNLAIMGGDVVGGVRRWVRDTTGKVSCPKITLLNVTGMYTWANHLLLVVYIWHFTFSLWPPPLLSS